MSKRISTNFQEVNLDHYLYSAIPVRFQGIDPSEFEDFIAHLLSLNGYGQVQTSYSADFGADLIIKKEGVKVAVQVKRYFELHKVGVSDIKQVIGAQQYYQCDQALMITTSSFTHDAKKLAAASGVLMWDWERLEKAISDTFLEGRRHQEYFQAYPIDISATESDILKLQIIQIEFPRQSEDISRIILRLTNLRDSQQKISCDLPIVITEKQLQLTAMRFADESFSSGILYGNATVEIICEYAFRQFSEYGRKDRLLLPVHLLQSQEYIVIEQKLGQVKKECFLVSFYYGHNSEEYQGMIDFRDQILQRSVLGRICIKLYYFLGSYLVGYLQPRPKTVEKLRPLINSMIKRLTDRP